MSVIRFRQACSTVLLSTDAKNAFDHAVGTLYAYQRDHGAAADWRVNVSVHPAHRDLQEEFSGATTVEIGPGLTARHQDSRYWISAHRTVVSIDRAQRVIFAACEDERAAMYFTARLVRQAMTAELLQAGAIYAHTAAVTIEGRGVLISGHRHHGKTTTALALLRHAAGHFVSNDRMLLASRNGAVVGHAWPSHIRAGVGTLLAYPDLADLVPFRLRATSEQERWTVTEKVSVEPTEFTRLLSEGKVSSAPCTPELMIWPDIGPQHRRLRVQRVDPDEVRDTLVRTRLFMDDPGRGISSHINHWLVPAPPVAVQGATVMVIADVLARDVPCYRVSAGGDPAALARAATDLLPGS